MFRLSSRFWIFAALLVLVGGLGVNRAYRFLNVSTTESEEPRVSIPDTIDLGRPDLYKFAHVSFEVGNTGGAPLIIHGVETNCQCKEVFLEESQGVIRDHLVQPGKFIKVGMNLMVSGSLNVQQSTSLRFHTNDPK
jgi:Protein of unknown function (DUF1573)